MIFAETRQWSFLLLPDQWLHDSCQVMWVTALRPPWQADVRLRSNDTFCRATSNRVAGQAAGEATGCPEKLGHGRWDGHYTPSHFKSPFPKSEPQGDLHHSMSSAWSTHSTLHTGPRAEKSKCVCVSVCFSVHGLHKFEIQALRISVSVYVNSMCTHLHLRQKKKA